MDLVMCQAFKEEQGVCKKCWVDNGSEASLKRLYMLDGTKTYKHGDALDLLMEKNFHWAILMKRPQAVVEKVQKAEASGKLVAISRFGAADMLRKGAVAKA
ncbi:hypothetical protein C0993_007602, partial [Termitomyces sp. T159_Od127]